MLFALFLTLGVAVLSVALRSYQSSFSQKAGALGILISSYLAIYFITGSHVLGAVAAVSWLFLPWLEILTRIRTLRLPKEKQLRPKNPPLSDIFPTLNEITRVIVPAIFSVVLQGRGPRPGHDLPERTARFIILLSANFVARAEWHDLDDLELPALLRPETHPAIPHQSSASRSIILAALPKPSGISSPEQSGCGDD